MRWARPHSSRGEEQGASSLWRSFPAGTRTGATTPFPSWSRATLGTLGKVSLRYSAQSCLDFHDIKTVAPPGIRRAAAPTGQGPVAAHYLVSVAVVPSYPTTARDRDSSHRHAALVQLPSTSLLSPASMNWHTHTTPAHGTRHTAHRTHGT
jgi:hypothetical protein